VQRRLFACAAVCARFECVRRVCAPDAVTRTVFSGTFSTTSFAIRARALFTAPAGSPFSVALDWSGRRLFWSDAESVNVIGGLGALTSATVTVTRFTSVTLLNSALWKDAVDPLGSLRAVVFDAATRVMYIADAGRKRIRSIEIGDSLALGDRDIVHSASTLDVHALAVHTLEYWLYYDLPEKLASSIRRASLPLPGTWRVCVCVACYWCNVRRP
jgi:hypothetical protein